MSIATAGRCGIVAMALGVLGASACDGGKTENMGSHAVFTGCATRPTAPPRGLGLNAFYTKYLDGHGTPVLSSAKVSDEALARACRITSEVLSARDDVRLALANNAHRVAVIATSEVTTDIPEYADLYAVFPDTDWNASRGLGATRARPVTSTGEENLLCLPSNIYAGQTILVQMLGHSLREVGIVEVDAQFRSHLQATYTSAMDKDLWTNTSAALEANVYWAIGTQVWFGANSLAPVTTRDQLEVYDPPLATLLAPYLPADDWHPSCD